MTFKETLEKARKNEIPVWTLVVANEVDYQFPKLSDEDFEDVCAFVYDWIMNSDINVCELCRLITDCLNDGVFTISDIKDNWNLVIDELNRRI